ncbi:MAG: hypothetical protein IJB59_01880 [Oscillospiraceae bacterium]|nr:hypothetical protein [Oscillospiraceae bacterium]
MENVLRTIAQANEEESKIYLEAAIRRREELLDGGEIICAEFSKEKIQRLTAILEQFSET